MTFSFEVGYPTSTRRGTAFCSHAQITLGRLASTGAWVARVTPRVTVPAGNPIIYPQPEAEQGYWAQLFFGGAAPFMMIAPGASPAPTLASIGSVDFLLPGGRLPGALEFDEGNVYDVVLQSITVRGYWTITGARSPIFGTHDAARVNMALVETTAPEPTTSALMGIGLLAIGGIATRRNRTA
jgi:hypothetical protein